MATPMQDVRARRRRSGDTVFLIRDNYYHELDEVTDALFLACDGKRTVDEIAAHLVERGLTEAADAREVTDTVLAHFEKLGIIGWKP